MHQGINSKVKGLESLNIEGDGYDELFQETLCGSPITFTGTFINPFEIEVTETDFSEFNKNIQTYAELNGIERRVSLDFDGEKIYMIDLLNGKKYEIN